MKLRHIYIIVLICSVVYEIESEVICSEEELVRELREDIEDNGKLDCLREIKDKEGNVVNKPAVWDSNCSFEAESNTNHWKYQLIKNYGLVKGLVDVNGNPVENDFDDQADMCEIIRALIANGVFPGISSDVTNINPDVVNLIECPGEEGRTKVCAATPSSFADKESWYIFLDGQSISFNSKPKYKLSE